MTMSLQEYPTSTVHDLCQIADKPVYLKKDVDELISRYDETISYYQEYVSYYQKELNNWVDLAFKKNERIAYLEMLSARAISRCFKYQYIMATYKVLSNIGINTTKERIERWCDKFVDLYRKNREHYLTLIRSHLTKKRLSDSLITMEKINNEP